MLFQRNSMPEKNVQPARIEPQSITRRRSTQGYTGPTDFNTQDTRKDLSRNNPIQMQKDPSVETLIPGTHPPDVEGKILKYMEETASSKADQGEWMEAYCILEKIYLYKREAFGDLHSDVANTLYHMGGVLMNLGNLVDALS